MGTIHGYNYGHITLHQSLQFMSLGYPRRRSILSSDRWRNPLGGVLLHGCDAPRLLERGIDVSSSYRLRPMGNRQLPARDAGAPFVPRPSRFPSDVG